MVQFFKVGVVAAVLGAASALSASANVVFDFGTLMATPADGTVCGSNCVLPTVGPHSFTIDSHTIIATGYSNQFLTPAFLTQKPGPFGPETGLGESDSGTRSTDPDFEIAPGKSVVLDNTLSSGQVLSVSIGSLQAGESAKIFTGATLGSLALFTTVTGTPDTQTVNLSSTNATFVGVLGVTNNSLVLEEVIAAPEPMSIALLGAGLFGLGLIRRRRS